MKRSPRIAWAALVIMAVGFSPSTASAQVRVSVSTSSFGFGGSYFGSYGGFYRYGYGPFRNYGYGHRNVGFYPNYGYSYGWRTPYYLPPAYLPAETLYGPSAVRRFLGVDPPLVQQPLVPVVGRPILPLVQQPIVVVQPQPIVVNRGATIPEPAPRQSNAAARDRARRFIEFGDNKFREQRFHEALQRYKKAVKAAPDLAEGYFREGHAYTALGLYERAATAYRRGLALDADWPTSDFNFSQLYDGMPAARAAHREALAQAAADSPENGDLLFVLGVQLHFDGEEERAATIFESAQARGAAGAKPFLDDAVDVDGDGREL